MENLHLKNLKHNNIEIIKQTSWFNEFNPEQQYYIESGLENDIDITKFAKKELEGDKMFNILQELEMEKYNETLTVPYHMFQTHEKIMKKLKLNTAYGAVNK
jgi:hypothetical protein